jgi:hypothetical protein
MAFNLFVFSMKAARSWLASRAACILSVGTCAVSHYAVIVLTRMAVYAVFQMSAVNSAGALVLSAESIPLARSMIDECCLRMRVMSR